MKVGGVVGGVEAVVDVGDPVGVGRHAGALGMGDGDPAEIAVAGHDGFIFDEEVEGVVVGEEGGFGAEAGELEGEVFFIGVDVDEVEFAGVGAGVGIGDEFGLDLAGEGDEGGGVLF